MDATNIFQSTGDATVQGWSSFELPPGNAHLSASPLLDDEVDAIVAATPRAHRAHARSAAPLLLTASRAGGITHLRRIAYVLASALHGSRFGAAMTEPAGGDGSDPAFERYEPETELGTQLGNTLRGDGERFRGRGFVYVRGRAAYASWSRRLGMPDLVVDGKPMPFFVADPAALARPGIAAHVIVRGMRDGIFTGAALGTFVNDKKTDFHSARRTINGPRFAREVADYATAFSAAIESVHAARHTAHMHDLANLRAAQPGTRDVLRDVGDAVERLARRGEVMPAPAEVVEWNGEARQGKFVQLDEHTCALHIGRGVYIRLDVQRDLNGIMPPEGCNMGLKRSGDVQPALRNGAVNFWR